MFSVLDQFISLAKRWRLDKKDLKISLTGGEPLISPFFFSLLRRIHKEEIECGILSNGLLLSKEIIQKLKASGIRQYQVSLEGMEKNNDIIRGKGSFKKIVNAIKLLLDNGILKIRISLTLNKKNAKDVFELADYLVPLVKKRGLIIIAAKRIVPWGKALKLKKIIQEPLELRDFYEKVQLANQKIEEKGISIRIVGGCENGIFNESICDNLMSRKYCSVPEGKIIAIMPNGDIYPCRRLPIKVGNILEKPLEEIYYSNPMKKLRNRSNDCNVCKKCGNYQECFGGAMCVKYAITGKINIPDVQCWRIYRNLSKIIN